MDEGTHADDSGPTLLRRLLAQRYWLPYRRFCAEYDKVAATLDRRLIGTYPSPTNYKRWLRGEVETPRSESCAVLTRMFPEYRVEQLFKSHRDDPAPLTLDPAAITTHLPADQYRVITTVGDMVIVAIDRRTFLAGSGAAVLTAGGTTPITSAKQVAPEVVEHLTTQLDTYYRADLLLGPNMVIPSVLVQYELIQQLLKVARGSSRQALHRTSTAYAGLATWLYQDAGDLTSASHWANQTLELAHRVADTQLIRHALTNRAMICTDQEDGAGTLDLTDAALVDEHGLCAKVRVQARQQAAHGHALIGDRRSVDRSLDAAAMQLDRVDDDYPWGNACRRTPGYIDAQRATCYTRLGLGREAVGLWEQVIDGLPATARRDAGVYRARQAAAFALDGQVREAGEAVKAAVEIAQETRSIRLRRELRNAWDRLTPWHATPVGRDVKEQLARL